MAPIPHWMTNGPAWMVEQWRVIPPASSAEDVRAVIQSTRALLDAVRGDLRFSWIAKVPDAA